MQAKTSITIVASILVILGAILVLSEEQHIIRDTNQTLGEEDHSIIISGQRIVVLTQYKNLFLIEADKTLLELIKKDHRYEVIGKWQLFIAYLQMLLILGIIVTGMYLLVRGHQTHKHLHRHLTYRQEQFHGTENYPTQAQTKRTRQKKISTDT